ncbi:MAG: hypothetical protein O3C21_19120 [Verrucomicrobia bacterium]|nr:hypothetical protein [Verrucomicrobiota bacterium]
MTIETATEHLQQEQPQKSPADYLGEVENMITSWEPHRTGDLEEFAQRLHHHLSEGVARSILPKLPFSIYSKTSG